MIAKDSSLIKKRREIRVNEKTNGEGIIICHELDRNKPVADPSNSLFKGLPSRLRGGSKELFLTKKEVMNEGKTEERKTGTKQKLRRKGVKERTNEDLRSKHKKE
jgi:hypothetical protein